MLSSRNVIVDTNPRMLININDILKKMDTTTHRIDIGSRNIYISQNPTGYANLMILAMDQIKRDNPGKTIHFHIPNIDEQFSSIRDTYMESILNSLYHIRFDDIDSEYDNALAKAKLSHAKLEADNNFADAIMLIIESSDENVSISFSDGSAESIVIKTIYSHNNLIGGIGHMLPPKFVRPATSNIETYNIDQQPLYISEYHTCDPELRGMHIPSGQYITGNITIDISADNLDAALNLNGASIIDNDDDGNLILGPSMREKCEYFVTFASNCIPTSVINGENDLNVWYMQSIEPVFVFAIEGVETIAKTIVYNQIVTNNTTSFTDPIDITKYQNTIINLIMSEIQTRAEASKQNTYVVRNSDVIDYDLMDINTSDMKIILRCNLTQNLEDGNIIRIKLHNVSDFNCVEGNNLDIAIAHIVDIIRPSKIDLIQIDL